MVGAPAPGHLTPARRASMVPPSFIPSTLGSSSPEVPMFGHRVLRRAIAASAALLAACRSGGAPPNHPSISTQPNVVTITAHDFALDAPDQIPAGLTTINLVNKGPSLHHIQQIKLDQGKTTDDF